MCPNAYLMKNINTVSHVFYAMKSLFLLRFDWMQVEAGSSKYKSRCLRLTAMYLMLAISLLTLIVIKISII